MEVDDDEDDEDDEDMVIYADEESKECT